MSITASITNDEAILKAIIQRLLNLGARAKDDARWLLGILPTDLQEFLRAEVSNAIRVKAANDPPKTRKIFLSLGKTARAIYGPEFARVKTELDAKSRAAVRKTEIKRR